MTVVDPSILEPSENPGAIESFIGSLGSYGAPEVFNPWRERSFHDLHPTAAADRTARLRAHLGIRRVSGEPVIIFCGEAPGWRGCRYSGIPFTSEAQLLRGAVPRVPTLRQRIMDAKTPLSEPSATVLWDLLRDCGVEERAVLWNAFPWHPMGEHMHKNRTPNRAERTQGHALLSRLLTLFPEALVIAVGAVAAQSVREVDVTPYATVRHPSFGGAPEFRAGVTAALQRAGLYRPPKMGFFAGA